MFKVVVGHSVDPESQDAIEEILEQCQESLADLKPQAGILLAALDFDHELVLQEINQSFPGIELIGCTTDGEMSSILGFEQGSLTLMLFCSDTVQIHAGVGHRTAEDAIAAAAEAVKQATDKSTEEAKLCITLPASYIDAETVTSGEEILKGLNLVLGAQIPVVGGTAGDKSLFQKSYQFFGTEVLTDALPVLIFSGDLVYSFGAGCGWQTIGKKSIVTKSKENVVYEIDGKSAKDFYQQYIGDVEPAKENPLAVYTDEGDRHYLRVPNLCDKKTGSITFLGNVPENSEIQLTEVSRDRIIEASRASFEMALDRYTGDKPEATLLFSCCCRRWVLGTRTKEEYQLVQNVLEKEIPSCGFYTYGEFSPLNPDGVNFFHQETFVTLLLGTE
ncbi:protein of unknown function DUF1745 [[Leptolyngbya] sp. PCC 7376]|uniref:FIST signal transduction protein n=1 Tax=[Leptolyngbya] sp. PCC 7376 TaxID=111781 RepID=UPI00029F37EB|nr:FIST N-terminal domain-containing protein [[Leptolyngbya] sp. PCC 7376]AFY40186.1 protein of unknown function DUF1745 [[Leptolyngbya] sp. PCC 7376]